MEKIPPVAPVPVTSEILTNGLDWCIRYTTEHFSERKRWRVLSPWRSEKTFRNGTPSPPTGSAVISSAQDCRAGSQGHPPALTHWCQVLMPLRPPSCITVTPTVIVPSTLKHRAGLEPSGDSELLSTTVGTNTMEANSSRS